MIVAVGKLAPVAKYAPSGPDELAAVVVEAMTEADVTACFTENHWLVVTAASPEAAIQNAVHGESHSRLSLNSRSGGGPDDAERPAPGNGDRAVRVLRIVTASSGAPLPTVTPTPSIGRHPPTLSTGRHQHRGPPRRDLPVRL